jgi:putative FmdB family regulatory protein
MPIYEYQCEETKNVFEINQSIKAEPLTKCNFANCECEGKGNVQRLISKNVGVIFNGSGFYETDYVRKNSKSDDAIPTSNCSNCAESKGCPAAQI